MEINFPRESNIQIGFDLLYKRLKRTPYAIEKTTKLNIFGIDISKEFNFDLANLIYNYNCELIGISDERLNLLYSIINTGYFTKKEMSKTAYYLYFRKILEKTDFPLMLLDNTVYNDLNTDKKQSFYLAQPLYFTETQLFYKKLKSGFAQPKDLELAIKQGLDIWEVDSVHILDLCEIHFGLRFASNFYERQLLDLYSEILMGSLYGFNRREGN